jgi:hypothetical protein
VTFQASPLQRRKQGGGAVPTVQDTVTEQLFADFMQASAELGSARLRMQLKDSTAHRAAVTEWEGAIDVLLDMMLQIRLAPPRETDRPTAHQAVPSAAAV